MYIDLVRYQETKLLLERMELVGLRSWSAIGSPARVLREHECLARRHQGKRTLHDHR